MKPSNWPRFSIMLVCKFSQTWYCNSILAGKTNDNPFKGNKQWDWVLLFLVILLWTLLIHQSRPDWSLELCPCSQGCWVSHLVVWPDQRAARNLVTLLSNLTVQTHSQQSRMPVKLVFDVIFLQSICSGSPCTPTTFNFRHISVRQSPLATGCIQSVAAGS